MNWKKIMRWTLASLAGLILCAGVAGYFYLKSNAFRAFALRKIIEQADQSTGGRTQIRAFDFDLATLTAHFYGIVIHGKEAPESAPLLQIDKLTIGLKIQSLIHRRISLSELLIERPVLRFQVDRNGNSNIPQAAPGNSGGSHTSFFDLTVGRLVVGDGEIDYNDRKTPLDADLHDLKADVSLDFLAPRFSGSVSYDNGHLRYGKYAPLSHGLHANFTATPAQLRLDSAVITVASSVIKFAGDITNYNDPAIRGNYDILMHSPDFSELWPTLNPAGDVALTGTLRYQNAGNHQPWLRNITVEGHLGAESLAAMVFNRRLEIHNVRGQYHLAEGSLQATGIEAETLGGRVSANLGIDHFDGTPASHVRAALQGISLNSMQRVARRPELNPVAISGTLDGTTEAAWTGDVSNAHVTVDLVLRSADGKNAAASSARNIPVEGAIHAIYDGPKNVLTLRQTTLRIPATTLGAEGQIGTHSHLEIKADTSDLHGVVALVSAFRPVSPEPPVVAGSATIDATVQGEIQKPEITARVSARDLQVQGSEWKSADLSLQANSSRIVISHGTLTNAHRGQASFDATIGLRDWSYLSSSPIQAHVSLRQMPVADLQHLADVQYPVRGELSAKISLDGSQLDPRGSGSVEVENARVYDEPLKTLALTFHGDNGSIVSDLQVTADAGAANASLTYAPKTKAYKVRIDAPAIVLQKLRTVREKNLSIQGTAAISADGEGTVDDPQLTAGIQLPQLEVKGKSIVGLKADIRVAGKRADLIVDSQVAQASVHARGHIDLTGDYQADASIDTGAIPLEVLWAAYSPNVPRGFSGQTEVHATLKGPLKNKTQIEAHLVIPTLTASYQSLQIGAASPIRADYSHSVFTIQPAEIRGTETSLRVQGSIPISGASAANLTAQGSIDARVFQIFSPDLHSSGTIALDVHATGSASSPQLTGQLRLQNIAFATAAAPLGIDELNGTLDLENDRVQISNLAGQVGGGRISAGGSITYRPSPQFDIAVQANSVRLRYPDGLRSVLDGNLAWVGNADASAIRGRVLVDSLSFTPDFDLGTFGDQFTGNAVAPSAPGFADTVSLQVAIQSKSNLSATSSQVTLEGTANLSATGTVANPVITGRADLTSGELFYRNVRYQLQRGIITLADPNETKPTLDVSVSTTVEQYNLTLNLRGPFDTLTTSYSSDPPLSTADIINLIARGKTSSELAASSQSTDSMIASQAASQFSGSVQKLAGISSLQIDPTFGGNNQNPSARLALQQRVSKNFLFTFSTDVTQPGEEIVQGDYQINKRWSVSVARDQLGGVSVDGRFHTRF
jgi:translocation and assembly module TamB